MANQDIVSCGRFLQSALKPERAPRIVDIGANPINHNPYDALLEDGIVEVYAFEPQPDAFAKLQQTPKRNQTVFNAALGDGTKQTLNLYKSDGFSSLLRPNRTFLDHIGGWDHKVRDVGQIDVATQRLDDLDGLPEIDLIKIDVQGAELQIFENGRKTLAKAQVVFSEVAAVQIYKDQPLLDDQMRFLRGLGYDLHKFMFFKSAALQSDLVGNLKGGLRRNQLTDGDAVFVRDLMQLEDRTDEALKHLAILAGTVFESADMTLRILDILAGRGVVEQTAVSDFVELYN